MQAWTFQADPIDDICAVRAYASRVEESADVTMVRSYALQQRLAHTMAIEWKGIGSGCAPHQPTDERAGFDDVILRLRLRERGKWRMRATMSSNREAVRREGNDLRTREIWPDSAQERIWIDTKARTDRVKASFFACRKALERRDHIRRSPDGNVQDIR